MPSSVNKGYELQVTGTNSNTWGDLLNDQVFEIVDRNLGGSVSKSLTNLTVNLTAEESQNLRLILNGTLTGDVLVTTQAVGMTIVENNCTGNFSVTFRHASGGTPVILPNGTVALVATTGAAANPKKVAAEFPTGTRMIFQQTTPPAGWTKDIVTSGLNNSAMRIVTGAAGSGGSLDFTTAFGSRALSGSVNGHTLTEAQMPLHGHPYMTAATTNNDGASTGGFQLAQGGDTPRSAFTGSVSQAAGQCIGGTGGNQSHNHGLTLNNLDISVRYTDVVVGIKI